MAYSRINFKNGAEGGTPLSAANMNHIEDGIVELETNKQDKLTAGSNITITGNTISATVPQVPNETVDLTFTYSDGTNEVISFVIDDNSVGE